MATAVSDKLKALALDLTKSYPRSPRETLAGYVVVGRALDKCRAYLNGTAGEYNYNCPLDRYFFDFTQIDVDAFTAFVATGASDEEVAVWVQDRSKVTERIGIVKWNNKLRYATPRDLPDEIQLLWEDYIPKYLPKNRPLYYAFDLQDLEEGRF